MIKKVCILASLSQKSDIEEAVAYYKSQGYIVDYPTEQRDKTLFEIDYDYICRIVSLLDFIYYFLMMSLFTYSFT